MTTALSRYLVVAVLTCGAALASAGAPPASASAVTAGAVAFTCSGTFASPGLLQGTYDGTVDVDGWCDVDGGPATVSGDLVVTPGAALDATFALDDQPGGRGVPTSLTVDGDLDVEAGAVALVGCEPNFAPCSDTAAEPGYTTVGGSLVATDALGVVAHRTTVKGNVTETGGGGGMSCAPSGPFAEIQSPPYSDYEDDTVDGNVTISGIEGCWMGSLRDTVTGDFTNTDNLMGDPDAEEVLENVVHGNLACSGNQPAVHYGDSGAAPNVVYGTASGECGFDEELLDDRWYFPGLVPAPNELVHASAVLPISQVPAPAAGIAVGPDDRSYLVAKADGSVAAFGTAAAHGSWSGPHEFPATAFAATPGGAGYWLASSTGQVKNFGDAPALGPSGLDGLGAAFPVVAMAATPDGGGIWLVGADGGVFSYGDAHFHGSEGGKPLNSRIVGIAPTPDGGGYWLVAADGGIFTFGDAHYRGSEGGSPLNQPVVGMAVTPGGGGYWLVAADGGIFTFGDAHFRGSEGGSPLNCPVTGMARTPDGLGYWLVGEDGGIFNFGDTRFSGSAA